MQTIIFMITPIYTGIIIVHILGCGGSGSLVTGEAPEAVEEDQIILYQGSISKTLRSTQALGHL